LWQTMFSTPAAASFTAALSRPSTSSSFSAAAAQVFRPSSAGTIRPPSRAGLPTSLLTPASTPRMVLVCRCCHCSSVLLFYLFVQGVSHGLM
jgi:hypothetical protein